MIINNIVRFGNAKFDLEMERYYREHQAELEAEYHVDPAMSAEDKKARLLQLHAIDHYVGNGDPTHGGFTMDRGGYYALRIPCFGSNTKEFRDILATLHKQQEIDNSYLPDKKLGSLSKADRIAEIRIKKMLEITLYLEIGGYDIPHDAYSAYGLNHFYDIYAKENSGDNWPKFRKKIYTHIKIMDELTRSHGREKTLFRVLWLIVSLGFMAMFVTGLIKWIDPDCDALHIPNGIAVHAMTILGGAGSILGLSLLPYVLDYLEQQEKDRLTRDISERALYEEVIFNQYCCDVEKMTPNEAEALRNKRLEMLNTAYTFIDVEKILREESERSPHSKKSPAQPAEASAQTLTYQYEGCYTYDPSIQSPLLARQ